MKKILTLSCLIFTLFLANAQFPAIGTKAPDLTFNNPEGKPISLSSLKGYVVLLDFWASWCRPCRMANPGVVQLYNKYKDQKWAKGIKGFTVFSFSLDMNTQAWTNAIAQDGLTWPYHASDLKGWNSAGGAKYGINSIPCTFLIDETGYIIAIRPPHTLIEEQLNKRLVSAKSSNTTKTKTTKSKTK